MLPTRSYLGAYNAWRASQNKPPAAKLSGTWQRWSKGLNREFTRDYDRLTWRQRAAEFDAYVERARREIRAREMYAELDRLAGRQERLREREREMSDILFERVKSMLKVPLFTRRASIGEDNENVVIIEGTGWKERDISATARLASELGRRGAALTGEIGVDEFYTNMISVGLDPQNVEDFVKYYESRYDQTTRI